MIAITLTARDLEYGRAVGSKRQSDCLAVGAVHKNRRRRDDAADLHNHQISASAELAAHYALRTRHWHQHSDFSKRKQADLDGFIDVKLRDSDYDRHLIVQFDDNPSFAYLSVITLDGKTFWLDRWCWGFEVMHNGFVKSLAKNRPAYCTGTAEPFMKDPMELRALVALHRPRPSDPPQPPQR